ncbi:MAG: hypothetical protein KAS73_14985 [Candidatus Sabulitectum sp.]|nr:hypothetical protein [Candidatus Sabulitectum sp.]
MRKTLVVLLFVCVAASFAGMLMLNNNTDGYNFTEVYYALTASDSWGENQANNAITPGDKGVYRINEGTYHVRVVDEDGDEYIFWNVEVGRSRTNLDVDLSNLGEQNMSSSSASTGFSGGAPATITINNNLSNWTIRYIYGSLEGASWGADRLGSGVVLEPGQSMTFTVPSNASYDFRCVDDDEDTYSIWGIQVGEGGYTWNVDLSYID